MKQSPRSPFVFTDYDKISDTLLWMNTAKLEFFVKLSRKDKLGNVRSYHSEYGYYSESLGKKAYNIYRDYSMGYVINCGSYEHNVTLRTNDIMMLQLVLKNAILPWFNGPSSIFGVNKSNKLCIKGKYQPVHFPISQNEYIEFTPIVMEFENGDAVPGIRFEINTPDNFFDITVDNFLSFAYIITHSDMVNMAMSMLNYVKTKPYNVGLYDKTDDGKNKGFFNN